MGCPRPCGYNIIFPQVRHGHFRLRRMHLRPSWPTLRMSFSFHARYALLTYAQCAELSEWDVLDHISQLGGECIIGREDHADGGNHLHVFVDWGRKRRFRRSDVFDVGNFHPNIAPSKGNAGAGWDYATKDGNVVAGGLERPESSRECDDNTSSKAADMAYLVSIEDADTFWESVKSLAPRLLLTSFPSLNSYASWRFRPRTPAYETPGGLRFDGDILSQLSEWSSGNIGCNSGVR